MFDSRFYQWPRALATSLCVAGALVLGYVCIRYVSGALRADDVRREWNDQQARSNVERARASSAASMSAVGSVAEGAPIARLWIPRIRLDEIVVEGVADDDLNAGPGHLPGSAVPGSTGNAIISAHRDRHFRRLDELQLGDTIRTQTGQSSNTWVIVSRRVVGRAAPALFKSKGPLLTLTTCWPVRYFGDAPDRLILSALPAERSSKPRADRTS